MEKPPGHVFVSYVHEDDQRVDDLCERLEAAGIRVWRDVEDLWPGEDWRIKIRDAITKDSLAFIACFSNASENKETSYQREEIALAVDEMRKRRPGKPWLLPVRFDEVDLPSYNLGPDRTLDSIQRIDITTPESKNVGRLISAITMILASRGVAAPEAAPAPAQAPTDPRVRLRSMLRDPTQALAVEDLLQDTVSEVAARLNDEDRYPLSFDQGVTHSVVAREVATRARAYIEELAPALPLIIEMAAYGTPDHEALLSRAVRTLYLPLVGGGAPQLISLRDFPAMVALYGGVAGALARDNFGMLRAITVDPMVRSDGDRARVSLAGAVHPWRTFQSQEPAANVFALEAEGKEVSDELIDKYVAGREAKRYTPIEGALLQLLSPYLSKLVPADELEDLWTATEIYLGVIVTDLQLSRTQHDAWVPGPAFGTFTWRTRYFSDDQAPETALLRELNEREGHWPPIAAGLFGRQTDRARAALKRFQEGAREARGRRF